MPSSHSPTKTKVDKSDPSTSRTPSRSNLGRGSAGSRDSSLSRRKRQAKQPLHIRMNLTETQMDRITDAFTSKVSSSPVRARQRVEATPTKPSRQAQQGSYSRHNVTCSLTDGGGGQESQVASATFSDLMPKHQGDIFSAGLAERRRRQLPAPIQVGAGRAPGRSPLRPQMEPVSPAVPPLSPRRRGRHAKTGSEDVCPYYPGGHAESLLYPGNTSSDSSEGNINGPVMDMYSAWAQMTSPSGYPDPPSGVQTLAQRPRRSKSTSDGLASSDLQRLEGPVVCPSMPPLPAHTLDQIGTAQTFESPLFSPLALYFRGHDFPTAKRGEKTMIGQNGWLERTERISDKGGKTPPKKAGILENIKRIAKGMTAEFHYTNRRSHPSAKEAASSQVRISLDAREQSLLYCELEYHLTTALNDYMTAELDKGHLVPDNLKKVSDWWANQGRPKVVGFRFDLETQLELVSLHVDDFNFYGRRQSNPVEIAGLFDAMKTNARQMRVRTFCQPDSVIAKQLVDTQSLFNMINVSNARQSALAEIAQFFKVIVERERDRGQRGDLEMRETRVPRPGQDIIDAKWQQQQQGR